MYGQFSRCLVIRFLLIPGTDSNSYGWPDNAHNTDDIGGGDQVTGDGMSSTLVSCWFLPYLP